MLREKFFEFCSLFFLFVEVKIEELVFMEMDNYMLDKDESCYDNVEVVFSDDEEDFNSKGKKREFCFYFIKEIVVEELVDIIFYFDQLDEFLRDKVFQLQKGSDMEVQCEVMQEIVDQVLEEDFDLEQLFVFVFCLQEFFKVYF